MERELFDELYRRYHRELFLYAWSMTHVTEDAEDAVADTFVKAITAFRGGNVRAWLYTVLRNVCLDELRRRKREVPLDQQVLEALPDAGDVLEQYIAGEELRRVYRELGRLPPLEREVLLLTVQTDYGDREIGGILGITPGHVRVLRHRGRQRLREKEEL